MHIYIYKDWERVPYVVALEMVSKAPNTVHLLNILLEALEKGASMISQKNCFALELMALLSFKAPELT